MAHHANSIATQQRVLEAAEAMLTEGYPFERISQNAIRARIGGGSMTTIHRYLKPFLDDQRAERVKHQISVARHPEYDPDRVPEAVRTLVERMKSSAEELGQVVGQLTDAAVSDERHRQEQMREREKKEHRRILDHMQSVLDEVRYDLEQTADEGAEYQEQLTAAQGRISAMEADAAEMRELATELQRQLQKATDRADAAVHDAAQKDARITDLEREIEHSRETLVLAEDRADRAEQRSDDAEKACAAAERRADEAHDGWRRAEAARAANAEARAKTERDAGVRRNRPVSPRRPGAGLEKSARPRKALPSPRAMTRAPRRA